MNKFILSILCVFSYKLQAQFIPVDNIPFEQYGQLISAPLTGGFNAVQLSDIDINIDGINDVFVFDRGGNVYNNRRIGVSTKYKNQINHHLSEKFTPSGHVFYFNNR